MQFFTKILNLESDMYILNFENLTLYAGLKIERARVPGARSFAVGHAAFASCVPGVHALVSLLFL